METMPGSLAPTARDLTARFGLLKQVYPSDLVRPERRANLCELVARYGYLPWSHQQALEELSIPEAVLVLEEKLRLNGVYAQGEFTFTADTLSPVSRAGYADSSWLKQAGHEIKLINLAGLGNGQASTEPGRLVDWLKQLVILPAGDLRQGVLGTTLYLLPFTARDFGHGSQSV